MPDQITLADIAAMEKVLDDVIEQSDQMDVATAGSFKTQLDQLGRKVKLAHDMVNQQACKIVEDSAEPVVVGNRTFAVEKPTKWVTDHVKLRQTVIRRVLFNPDSGAKRKITMEDAVTEAIDIVVDLFVAPSDVPKQAGLKKLRLAKTDVCEEVETGKRKLIEVDT